MIRDGTARAPAQPAAHGDRRRVAERIFTRWPTSKGPWSWWAHFKLGQFDALVREVGFTRELLESNGDVQALALAAVREGAPEILDALRSATPLQEPTAERMQTLWALSRIERLDDPMYRSVAAALGEHREGNVAAVEHASAEALRVLSKRKRRTLVPLARVTEARLVAELMAPCGLAAEAMRWVTWALEEHARAAKRASDDQPDELFALFNVAAECAALPWFSGMRPKLRDAVARGRWALAELVATLREGSTPAGGAVGTISKALVSHPFERAWALAISGRIAHASEQLVALADPKLSWDRPAIASALSQIGAQRSALEVLAKLDDPERVRRAWWGIALALATSAPVPLSFAGLDSFVRPPWERGTYRLVPACSNEELELIEANLTR